MVLPILDNMTYSDIKLFYVRMPTFALLVVGRGKRDGEKNPLKNLLLRVFFSKRTYQLLTIQILSIYRTNPGSPRCFPFFCDLR